MSLDHEHVAELAPITLNGKTVRLEPLSVDHVTALWEAGS